MGGVFISYRRGDAEGQARALSVELAKYIGETSVFMDVDSIALGRDFRQSLHESLKSCDALLALIGPHWLDSADASGRRRLDDPADFVRQEIATALKRNIPVAPVLLQGATIPPQDRLPDEIKDLAFRNGFELSHTRWHSDVREMLERLGLGGVAPSEAAPAKFIELPGVSPRPAGAPPGAGRLPAFFTRRRAIVGAAVAAAAAGGAIGFPAIRRFAARPAAPSLRRIAFDYAAVDGKGARLATPKASAAIFTEPLSGGGAGLDMAAIPGGEFVMGSPLFEPERRANEGPQHAVRLAPFFLGASPVTQAQWAAVAALHPEKIARGLDPSPAFFKGADLPVESISWNEADEFCRRLAELTGRAYRLPTEAEWEYACRAGSAAPFNVGPTITSDLANYCGTGGAVCGESGGKSVATNVYDGVAYGSGAYDQGPVGTFRGRTTPAGTFPPNRFGLYDMHGDVWEYCLDAATPDYSDASAAGAANLAGGGERILRGGSWSHNPAICRSAYRDMIAPDNPGWQGRIGFRVACTI